jgi:hypothetical protein
MKTKRIVILALISAALAVPLGGFVFGFMHCDDCGFNIFGRSFIGLIFAVLTPLSGGFPPQNEGGVGPPFNAWPHITGAWVLLFSCLCYRQRKRIQKKESTQAPEPIPQMRDDSS